MGQRRKAYRIDAWTHEDDVVLADTVIDTVSKGGSQLNAFDLASKKLGRTPRACGFRWNHYLRHLTQNKQRLEEAKIQGREVRRELVRTGYRPLGTKPLPPQLQADAIVAVDDLKAKRRTNALQRLQLLEERIKLIGEIKEVTDLAKPVVLKLLHELLPELKEEYEVIHRILSQIHI